MMRSPERQQSEAAELVAELQSAASRILDEIEAGRPPEQFQLFKFVCRVETVARTVNRLLGEP